VLEFRPINIQLKQTWPAWTRTTEKVPVFVEAEARTAVLRPRKRRSRPPVESDSQLIEDGRPWPFRIHTAVLRSRYFRKDPDYSGKKKEAEVKISYNARHPGSSVIRAVVISDWQAPGDSRKGKRIVMDAEWNVIRQTPIPEARSWFGSPAGVEIGSTIEVELEIAFSNRPYLAGFEPFPAGRRTHPENLADHRPGGPQSLAAKLAPDRDSLAEHSDTTKGHAFEWSATNVKRCPRNPSCHRTGPFKVGVAYFAGDPAAYYQTLHKTMLDRAGKSAQAGALARRLVAATSNRGSAAGHP